MYYILFGTDENRTHEKIEALKKKHQVQTVIEINAEANDQSDVLSEMDSFSIFDDKKMILIQNATFLSSKNTTKYEYEPFVERSDSSDQIIVVFVCPTQKLDTRKKAYKALVPRSTVYECKALDNRSQYSYIQELLKEYHVHMDRDAFSWVQARIGTDPMRIRREIEKLSIYSTDIHLEDVQALIVPEPLDDVFKMVNALFQRNGLLVLSYYRNFRALNMQPVAINGLLASQIRFLFQVHVCMDEGMNKDEIARLLKAHPYRVQVNMEKAYNFSSSELLEQLSMLAELDQNMKMGKIDKDEGFEQFILKMMA